jgi:hypothetical protein
MRAKILVLLTVLALLLGTVTPALAQDAAGSEPPVFCGDLSKEDCAVLQKSHDLMQQVAQNTALTSLDVTLNGIPGLPAETINAAITSNMKSVADPAAMAAALKLNGLTQEETLQMLADDPQPIVDLISGWSFDESLNVTVTPELAALISAQSGLDVPDQLAIQAKLVDGVLYWDLSEVAAFVPTIAAGWVGFPLLDVVNELVKQGAFEQALQAMQQQNAAGAGGVTIAGFGSAQFIKQYAETFQKFMTIKSGDVVDVNGKPAATYDTTMDVSAFLSSPEFQQIVVDLAKQGAFEGTGMTAADIEQNVQMLGMMGPMLFTGITATAKQTIGLDDFLLYDYESEVAWDMSGLVQMAAASGQLPAELKPTSDKVGFDIKTTISNSDMSTEATETIDAPADAQMIPLESVLNSMTAQ